MLLGGPATLIGTVSLEEKNPPMLRSAFALLTAAALAAPAAAQFSITVSGRVEAVAPGACNQNATHQIACTDVLLLSSTVNLGSVVGQTVHATGSLVPQLGCITLDVAEVEPASDVRLSVFTLGSFRIGTTITLLSTAPLGVPIVHFFAVEGFFLPLGPAGSYLLNPLNTQQWAIDLGLGPVPFPRFEQIPNNPALVGCNPYFQFLAVDLANPFDSRLSNAICFTITG